MKKIILVVCSILFIFSTQSALANSEHHAIKDNSSTMTVEYMKAMDDMHKPMMDGIMEQDPDVAFVKGMIPHHQGAIDMAKIELKYGKDPEIRALAEEVIKTQEKEIEFMKQWLEKYQAK